MVDTNNQETRKYNITDNELLTIGLMDFSLGGVGSV